MKLSVVIVNYNVAYFLEQALTSVYKALRNVDGEVFVVDNNSADNSLAMLEAKFPQVHLIANKENVGFAKANNQAIREAQGEYVLLLNPDTVVEEDTFEKCIRFMDETPDAGGLGVKMVNGKGEFLPESKRGIPFPAVAFYKLFGLSKMFPNSRKFGAYHLTYLDNDQIHSVEVLSGAFMMLRKSVLDQIGLLDEDYFMYGEDIDLSYRILKGGYKNYYFPETRIIHYKGESTKTGSLNYVHIFYKAMQIFARKHFSQKNAKLFNGLIDVAIWFRASLAALKRIFSYLLLPIVDFVLIYAGVFALSRYWDLNILAARNSLFPKYYYYLIIPIYIVVWLVSIACCKGYRKPVRLANVNKGVFIGTVCILLVYALLPETLRFSRAVVLLGTMWTLIAVNLIRYVVGKLHIKGNDFDRKEGRRIAVVGALDEAERVLALVQMMENKCEMASIITIEPQDQEKPVVIGHLDHIQDLIPLYHLNEVIFCARDLSSESIIDWMGRLRSLQVEFKIAPEDSSAVIGSNSIFSSEDIYTVPVHSLVQKENLRRKRAFDIASALVLLLMLPVDIWFVQDKGGFVRNIFKVLGGKMSWVSCHAIDESESGFLRPGVLSPADAFRGHDFSGEMLALADNLYKRDYKVKVDAMTMAKGFRNLGRESIDK
ncbi:MAG: glycosyltransferase family 2 protein [Bacteroidales bacterium]|nr:glycosyltransferase family 2 protein [Bacteroidales bacterium]